ncbi:conjugation peptidase TraF. Serine peptidase. MEROPS family S26C [Nitrosovibrio sp. Nv4]|nr:conjugation peptidase TraF. Serine peptidase. MEROPS family S26C [Nitrosovibrio sp. Nv4]
MPDRIGRFTAISGASVLVLGFLCYAAGARINTTRSIPIGLYWIIDAPVTKGAFVIFCPPRLALFDEAKARGYITAGFCPGEYGLMMKQVVATEHDTVVVGENGITINKVLQPSSTPLRMDKAGRVMPRYQSGSFTLQNSELLLLSGSRTSFDSRYFGPIQLSQIKGVIFPVFTW